MAKINFYLRVKNATSATPIILTVSYNKERVKLATGESIDPQFWNDTDQRPRQTKKFPTHPEFRTRLDNLENKVKDILRTYQNDNEGKFPTSETLKDLWSNSNAPKPTAKPLTFFEYLDKFIKDAPTRIVERSGKPFTYNTIKGYISLKNSLIEFSQKNKKYKKLDFNQFDLEFYLDFQKFLNEDKKLAVNTIGSRIKNLKSVLNNATEHDVNTFMDFKKKRFKVIKEETDAIYLTLQDLKDIEEIDLSHIPKLDRVRDLFLIACWTGVRFSDLKQIRPERIETDEHGEFIEVRMKKTGNDVSIPILPTVRRIMDKYKGDLPKTLSNQKMNDYLKEIGKLVGLDSQESKTLTKGGLRVTKTKPKYELMTTHTARRSFCTNNYLAGMDSISIMAISGHRSEREFLGYIKVTPREHANKIRAFWNKKEEQQPNNILKIAH
ncbi:MAG: site-specific integrase [Arcicella sp.]|jgi:integrase|nr:site-specific integrase [Arcicella sp.]